jgi:teichuronic acid biosynthesis glycosyltransferase TuaG
MVVKIMPTNIEEKVSIITPAYNSEKFISHTIESVLAQTYQNWEMIIVDDKSNDKTIEIVQQYQKRDERIKLFQLPKNSGTGVARNTAIEKAQGRYLAFLDSDDQWFPNKLEKQLAFMQEKDIAFSYTAYVKMTEDGNMTDSIVHVPEKTNYEELLKHCVVGCLTVMLDKAKVGEVRMMNRRLRQDYVLWLTLAKKGFTPYGLQEVLAKYRVVSSSISSNKLKAAKQQWKVYREVEGLNIGKSIWYFLHYMFLATRKYFL